jgi:hypothetical protein
MALDRLKFITRHPNKFDNIEVVVNVSTLKLIELLFTEVVTIIILSTFNNIEEIVVN